MSDLSLTIITATAGSSGSELSFSSVIGDTILDPDSTLKIGLDSNKFNVDYTIELVSGNFDGSYSVEDFGYSTTSNSSIIKTATFISNSTWNSSATFKIVASFREQQVDSNEFTINSSGNLVDKTFTIDTDNSVLTGLDNSLQNLEVLINRSTAGFGTVQGQQEYTTTGTYEFIVPQGVTQISAVAISGGGAGGIGGGAGGNLSYNTFSVTPGETLTVVVGKGGVGVGDQAKGESTISFLLAPSDGENSFIDTDGGCVLYAPGGKSASVLRDSPQTGDDPNWLRAENTGTATDTRFTEATSAGQTLNLGGKGGYYNRSLQSFSTSTIGNQFVNYSSAGGGAAGYNGNGGDGAPNTIIIGTVSYDGSNAASNSGGGGGGSTARGVGTYYIYNGAGGGVGLYGIGTNGQGGTAWNGSNFTAISGTGGSSGGNGTGLITTQSGTNYGRGGSYGGGGAGIGESTLTWSQRQNTINQDGGDGAVRLIWGENRVYPGTNVDDVEIITQEDVDSISGVVNDTPAYKVNLTNPLATTSLPRSTSAFQFNRGQSTSKIVIPIIDDPGGFSGTNIGTFTLQISDATDNYAIVGGNTVDLTVNSNPNPPVREISIDVNNSLKTVNEGDNFDIIILRNSTRNGVESLEDTVTVNWEITSTDLSKFEETTGTIQIPAGASSTTIQLSTVPDFTNSGPSFSGTFTITSAESSAYGVVDIVTDNNSVELTINNVEKSVYIRLPIESTLEIEEGTTDTIQLYTDYIINEVVQTPEEITVNYEFLNKDSRISNQNSSITFTGSIDITLSTQVDIGLQETIDTVLRLTSSTNDYVLKSPTSKIIKIIDSANVVKTLEITSNNITITEGETISITVQRVSTADDIDNYNDGGTLVPWRIVGSDPRLALTSGVINFANGETSKTLTILTTDNNTGGADTVTTFEIYEPTNGYSILQDKNTITLTVNDNDPIYDVTVNSNFVNESEQITFNIQTTRVDDSTTVYGYLNLESASKSDFTGSVYTRDTVNYSNSYDTINPSLSDDSAYGNELATKGDLLVVGDVGATVSSTSNAGQVKIYRNVSGSWTLEQTLTPPSVQEDLLFGYSVAVDGDYIIVGAIGWDFEHPTNPSLNELNNGAAYIYKYNSVTETWSLDQNLPINRTSVEPYVRQGAAFGHSVAIDGSYAVVGAPYGFDGRAGQLFFYYNDQGSWTQIDYINGSSNTSAGDRLGLNLSMYDNVVVDGAAQEYGSFASSGKTFVFNINKTANTVTKTQTLSHGGFDNGGEQFGYDVSVFNNWLSVIWRQYPYSPSSNSRLQIYKFVNTAWQLEQTIDYAELISEVEINDNYMFVIAQSEDLVYELQGSTWTEIVSLTNTNAGIRESRRQSAFNNITNEIFRFNGSTIRAYQPSYPSPPPITIVDSSATFSVTTAADLEEEAGEKFRLELWSGIAPNGSLLSQSNQITISESTYAIGTDKTEYNEGDTITVNIEADLSDGDTKTFTITGIQEEDIDTIGGDGLVSGSWSSDTYTGTIQFSKSSGTPLQQVWSGGVADAESTWTVPDGVFVIKAVAVGEGGTGVSTINPMRGGGGGALAYDNNISVTPGEILSIIFENGDTGSSRIEKADGTVLLKAANGKRGNTSFGAGGQASDSVGASKNSGASGKSYQQVYFSNTRVYAGGGGAAGYTNSGDGTGSGQSGYVGTTPNTEFRKGGGGGIGLLGRNGSTGNADGEGSYGGSDGSSFNSLRGGRYGGGGAAGTVSTASNGVSYNGNGGVGGIRIMWGDSRTFPSSAIDATGPPDTVASSSLTITLAEDLSLNEGLETLILNVDDTTIKQLPINDTSFRKEYYISDPASGTISKTEGDSGYTISQVTVTRTLTDGSLEIPLTWSGTAEQFVGDTTIAQTNTNKTLTFADGVATQTFNVGHKNDTVYSGDATGTFTLGEVAGWTRGSPYILTYNLLEDEVQSKTVTIQLPSGINTYQPVTSYNLLITASNASASGATYRLYKISDTGSLTLKDTRTITHTTSESGRFYDYNGNSRLSTYTNVTVSGPQLVGTAARAFLGAPSSGGSLGMAFYLASGGYIMPCVAGVTVAGATGSTPTLTARSSYSWAYVGRSNGTEYMRGGSVPNDKISNNNYRSVKMFYKSANPNDGTYYATFAQPYSVSVFTNEFNDTTAVYNAAVHNVYLSSLNHIDKMTTTYQFSYAYQ